MTVLDEKNLFSSIPQSLRDELLDSYKSIHKNYRENRWEPSELNGGKLCEVAYTIVKGYIDGNFPSKSSKPTNMVIACQSLENTPSTINRSIRIQIPRMIIALYEIRNNRGVGHSGNDVNPSKMDSTCVLYMSKWIVSELIRIFHNVDTKTAEIIIDSIMDRTLPIVWMIGDKLRILDTHTSMKEKTLLLLYHNSSPIKEEDLIAWIEHSNASVYRRDVLRPMHRDKYIEFDEEEKIINLSPKGSRFVESNILPTINDFLD